MSDRLGSTASSQQLAPFPEVNAVVHDLLKSLHAILGAQLHGMYLVGSLALGDFHPLNSDLDLVVVTVGTLSDETVAALRELHRRFDHSGSAWARRLDAVYIPQEVLREPSPSAVYPIVEWPGLLSLGPLESGWPIQRYTLREYGVVVSGPDPCSLLDTVKSDDLRQASAVIVERWQDQAHSDREWPAWLREPANLTFVVLTLCRLLYTLDTGSVASKPAAARWAARMRATRYSELIGRATTKEWTNAADVPVDAVNEALAFLEYTYERYRQWQADIGEEQVIMKDPTRSGTPPNVAGVITQPSSFSVEQTLERLRASVQSRNLKIFAQIDHSDEAEQAGLHMPPAHVLIFGSPKAGTPLMLATPLLALELPLKALVWQDADGQVWVSYESSDYLADRFAVPPELVKNIAGIEAVVAAAL